MLDDRTIERALIAVLCIGACVVVFALAGCVMIFDALI